jgi:alanyl aminopeptidase
MLKFRFCTTLLLLVFATSTAFASVTRLGDIVEPVKQTIKLTVDPSTPAYSGSTEIALRVNQTADHIRLHADGIEISSLELLAPTGPLETEHAVQDDVLTVTAGTPIEAGEYTLRIEFSNEFNTQAVGLYRMEAEGVGYAYTQFEDIDARKAFPCFDEPAFKIPFQLTITAREQDTVVTNTPVASESVADGWKTIAFGQTKPLPTYLLAIAVGPMDSVEIPGLPVPGRIYTPKGMTGMATYSAQLTAPILEALQDWFGMPYPYEKLDFISIAEYWPGAMEHPGAITFSDRILLLDPQQVSARQKRVAALVIAHELAHQWFGNLVTMEWWDDLWLNESFADWMGDKMVVQLYPEMRHDLAEMGSVNRIMSTDSRATAEPVRQPVEKAGDLIANVGLAYAKGKAVIDMFERWIGETAFRSGVHQYLEQNAWGNAEAADFWRALSEAAGSDVASSMATFLEQPGVPLVEVSAAGNTVFLKQSRFANHGVELPPQTWRIPVALRIGADGQVLQRTVLLAEPEQQLVLPGVDSIEWIMPAADGAGYYRWSIGDEPLKVLVSDASDLLSDRERIALMGNLGAALDGGMIGGETHVQAVSSFANDPEPLVISAVLDELDKVDNTFVTPELEDGFAAYIKRSLSPLVDRYGVAQRTGESETVTAFRPRLLLWMGAVARDESIVAWAKETSQRYAQDPSSVDPSLAGVSLRIVAKDGDAKLFEEYARRFEEASSPALRSNYLQALGAFEDPAIRDRALTYVLEGPLRPNELFTIPTGIAQTNEGANLTFQWMTDHYAQITQRMPPLFVPFLARFGGGCDAERLERAKRFFSDPAHRVDGTDKQLEQTETQVMDCVRLQEREAENVAAYLKASM